jgi:hypothetical protein
VLHAQEYMALREVICVRRNTLLVGIYMPVGVDDLP